MLRQLASMFLQPRGKPRWRPSMDTLLAQMDQHLDNLRTRVWPAPQSRPRTSFEPSIPTEQLSTLNFTARQRLKAIRQLAPLMLNMWRSARMYDNRFAPRQTEVSPQLLAELEALLRAAGARDIGYVKVPNSAIFRDKSIPCEYAIIFTVEMNQEPISSAPSFDCMHEVMRGYRSLAAISNQAADFLRGHGFAAYPGTALGGLTDYPWCVWPSAPSAGPTTRRSRPDSKAIQTRHNSGSSRSGWRWLARCKSDSGSQSARIIRTSLDQLRKAGRFGGAASPSKKTITQLFNQS